MQILNRLMRREGISVGDRQPAGLVLLKAAKSCRLTRNNPSRKEPVVQVPGTTGPTEMFDGMSLVLKAVVEVIAVIGSHRANHTKRQARLKALVIGVADY